MVALPDFSGWFPGADNPRPENMVRPGSRPGPSTKQQAVAGCEETNSIPPFVFNKTL